MRKALYVILTALLLVHNITGIKAQGYPVQATLNIGLPHSPLLEDYYSGANPLFNLNVLYKDFNSTRPLPVRINFTIESNNGFKLTTNPSFTPQPLYINGGENYRIEDSELSQYFGNSALLITGSGSNNFASQRRLPEGFYRITLRVHEYHRNIPISNVAIAVVWIKDNDPPQWVMPQNNTTIKARFPQNISFSWMKRHIPPPVGRSEVVYRFELFEMNNPSVTPEVVVRSQRPLYSEDVDNTTLIYSADKPMLTPGKSYVCRIQAKDELNYLRFKNSGYSTPLKFTFGKECRKPYNIQIQEPTKSGVTVDWQTDYFGDPTELRIRETGANQSEWYGYKSSNQTVNVHQLYAGRDYEIQLRNVCDQDLYSEWTQPQALRTQSPETTTNNQRNCTGKEISVDITDPTPLAVLEVGDIITVNGFPVTITSVEGSNGLFSGTGDMFVPFTGGKIQSVFSNITVTNSMQVSAGQVRAVRGPKVTFTNQGSDNNNADDADDDNDKFTVTGDTLTLTNGGGIDSLYLNGDGDVIIIDTHGDTINTGKKDITIVDNTGGTGDTDSDTTDTYVVQGGTITKTSGPASTGTGGSSGSASQSVNDSNIKLRFISPIDDGSGGFDRPLHQVMISGGAYNSRQYDGNNYYVPWRSVESGKSAFIVAELKIDNDTLKAEHITFTNDAGVKLQVQPAAGPDKKATYIKVLINETSHEEVQRVTAGYTIKKDKGESENRELAWIDVISYNSEPVDLVIATANGQKPTVPLSRLEQEINRIYGQSVIRFRLSQIDLGNTDFDKNGDNLVDAGSTGMLSNYTAETRAIKRAVRRHQAYDKKAFYIVMAPEASEGAMLKGRWALKTQVGFVFNPKGMSEEQFIHTVAHESGHGIFRLWHTFSSKNNYQLAKGATTNLMDYSTKPNATDLFKYQWDYCHNPENMTGLFQDDEEGEYDIIDGTLHLKLLQEIRCAKFNNLSAIDLSEYTNRYDKKPNKSTYLTTNVADKSTLEQIGITTDLYISKNYDNRSVVLDNISVNNENTTFRQHRGAHGDILHTYSGYIDLGVITLYSNDINQIKKYINASYLDLNKQLSKVLIQIDLSKPTEEQIKKLKSVAACGSQFISVGNKAKLIEAIIKFNEDEYYEDLVLDLIKTTKEGDNSRELYTKLMSNSDLLSILARDLDNTTNVIGYEVGEENNLDRFFYELFMLFKRSYSEAEFDDIARNIPDKNKYYFYSINKNSSSYICDRNVTDVIKSGNTITIKESFYEMLIINTAGVGSKDNCKFKGENSYSHKLDDILIVTNSGYDLSIDQGIYVMPAYAYYLLIKAANDRLIEQNLQSLFFAVTAITPFDEFFLIGKALKYSYKGLKSVNYVKARNLLSIKPCVLKPKYKKLFAGHTEKLKKYVKFGEDVVNISEDLIRSYKKGITTRIAKTKGFSLIHSDDELIAIIKKGIELKIPRDEIEDFIFVSCRDAKLINATDLIQQMDNWINVIKKRGYPYKFASKPEFTKFSNELRSGLDDLNISTSDIRIQGSSLRTPDAKDVDLAVIISDIEFNNILINRFSGRITKNKVEIDISSMKTSELRNLALEIESAPSDLFNGQARSFQTAYLNRKISAYSNDKIIPGMKQLYTKIKNEYKGLNIENISVQTSGGSMDLKPFIKI